MFCRRAWQRLGPLARRAIKPSSRNALPARHMSYGIPGGSTNMAYFVLCGGGLTAAVVYAYKTVSGDSERYNDRLADMSSKTKDPEADLLTTVKILTGSTVEIAAASVGEASIVTAVRHMEGDGNAPEVSEPILEVLEPNATLPDVAKEEVTHLVVEEDPVEEAVGGEAAPAVASEEEPKSEEVPAVADAPAEEVADSKDVEAPAEEEVIAEEEAAASPSDEDAVAAPAVEDEAEAEAPVLVEKAAADEATVPEEAAPAEKVPDVEISVEEAAAEASAEAAAEASAEAAAEAPDTNQLVAASAGSDVEVLPVAEPESTSEASVEETQHCHSCHAPATAVEEEAPPAAWEEDVQVQVPLANEQAMDLAEEAKEETSPVEGQSTESMAVVAAES